jgi:SNF2 family DNA or RNA helicase
MRIEAALARTKDSITVTFVGRDHDLYDSVRKQVTASHKIGRTDRGVAYRYPLSVGKCREMRSVWGADLKVHRDLGDWYRQASMHLREQVARTSDTDAKLTRVPAQYPKLNAWLKGDQRVTAAWIADAYRSGGLLADEVGTGKTAGVVAGLVEADITGPTLIICPKVSVRSVWLRELTRHTSIPVYACAGPRKKRERAIVEFLADPSEFKVLVVVAEMLRVKASRSRGRIEEFYGYEYPQLFDVEWAACVIDESHKVLGSMDVVKGNLAGEGIKALSYRTNRLKLAVSATPFGKGGRTEALFGTLHWLWPDEFPSRWAWLGKYFHIINDRVFIKGGRGATKEVKRIGGVKEEGALWEDLGPRVLRRTMAEVSPEHRGLKNYIEVMCELDGPQAKQYKEFTDNAELVVEGGILSTVGVLDYLTRARQLANGVLRMQGGRVQYTGYSAKIDRLLDLLEAHDNGRKVVVASQWNEYLDVVQSRLHENGYQTFRIDGSVNDRERERQMAAFQDPNQQHINIMLLNSQAGGVSITLDQADELHALDEMYPPEANEQLFGRIFRRGRVHEVFFYLYRAIGTIDEEIGYNVAEGQQKQARLLDGRRGLAYARELAKYNPEG